MSVCRIAAGLTLAQYCLDVPALGAMISQHNYGEVFLNLTRGAEAAGMSNEAAVLPRGDDGARSALAAAEIANFRVPRDKITKSIFDVDGTASVSSPPLGRVRAAPAARRSVPEPHRVPLVPAHTTRAAREARR